MKAGLPTYGVFLGVGGIGMSALARYFNQHGVTVWGYDKTPSPLTGALAAEGITISFDDDVNTIPESITQDLTNTWVVYTPAIPVGSVLKKYFESNKVNMMKRAGLLGELSRGMDTFAIAGTHGKTTSTTLAAWVLNISNVKGNAFLGGISGNFNSNLLLNNESNKLVVEADEFDRSFLTLSPNVAMITATDPDHLDIYKTEEAFLSTFQDFANLVDNHGVVLVNEHATIKNAKAKVMCYGWESTNDYCPTNCVYEARQSTFDLVTPSGVITGFVLSMPGKHNLMNAVGVAAVMLQWGIDADEIKQAYKTFKGIKRRFEWICELANDGAFIDDYAHHPKELDAAIGATRLMFPNKKVTGVFQPHLFSRTQDFVDGFAQSLAGLDELFLMDIYPAREEPIEGVTATWLLDKIALKSKKIVTKVDLVEQVVNSKPEVLLTLGAGDIDRMVNPLKIALTA
jgi:UDP-N-acetylmuramate--alanine ligase